MGPRGPRRGIGPFGPAGRILAPAHEKTPAAGHGRGWARRRRLWVRLKGAGPASLGPHTTQRALDDSFAPSTYSSGSRARFRTPIFRFCSVDPALLRTIDISRYPAG